MLKLKHLRHPLRTLAKVKAAFASYLNIKILATRGDARFKDDARYNLRSVRDGFLPRLRDGGDTAILQRICDAYFRAAEGEPFVKQVYQPTKWWNEVRQTSLGPVRRALASRDLAALDAMYRNFFRDSCSAGLIGVPYKMSQAYRGAPFDDRFGRLFLSNALHRIDYWNEQTGNRYALRDLAGPDVGNPFGILLAGILVRSGTESQHYFAQRIAELLPPSAAVVTEIGGGYGGVAYYLLRDHPQVSYCNFDVLESTSLASYYLLKSFPHLRFLLYGEQALSAESLSRFRVALMPACELAHVPTKSADLTFCCHTLSSLTRAAMIGYLDEIARVTRKSFLYIGRREESNPVQRLIRTRFPQFRLAEKRFLEWNKQRFFSDYEIECLYQLPEP